MAPRVNKDAERNNPCFKEQEQSYECLNKNGFDQAACEHYFDNYNTCKKFWGQVARDRRYKGIKPEMPDAEERARIKENFMKARQQLQDS